MAENKTKKKSYKCIASLMNETTILSFWIHNEWIVRNARNISLVINRIGMNSEE